MLQVTGRTGHLQSQPFAAMSELNHHFGACPVCAARPLTARVGLCALLGHSSDTNKVIKHK